MELSEHESRILKEIEEDLTAGDPRLALAFGASGHPANTVLRIVLGTAAMGLGIGLMIFALASRSFPVGVLAFTAMTAGAYVAAPPAKPFRAWRMHRRGAAKMRQATDQ
ncbi:DUF3040 domain-containing protein [Arthrobacter wenxiniae]|jgi:hypothetical protein|uniref:DUF3040 domain-containing protein n=1 Tax=Arthrobacter wenxiniae TaxID=2713570 RepID=A0A7Y7IEV2_9MICC|nr:DUF3040 domain-containing protein [Arthrobacter wenxiniae]NVM94199.1 DUF3040 domain-containing protein [Arthrobacter wenxiniae]